MPTVEKYETAWTRSAKRRWPGYYVSGDGPYALVNSSLTFVHLYDFEMFAVQDLNERNDAQFCTLVRLTPDYGTRSVGRSRASADTVEHRR